MTVASIQRVIVGMSGGVDSAVAALLLLEQGLQVEALFMKNWEEDDTSDYCSAAADLADATAVCEKLSIELHTANFATEYWQRVFTRFLAEYRAGRTPNPDILCNTEIKFRAFLEHAQGLGADGIATGHYARIQRRPGDYCLLRGIDDNKDQSYFLHGLNQQQLQHSLFPIGGLPKPQVRELAKRAGLPVFAKKDSTGICFIGERPFREFLQQYLPAQPGDIVDLHGDIVGRHQGLMYYTLGQRQGLGIGGKAGADQQPWFVAGKDLDNNTLLVVQGHDHPLLLTDTLTAIDLHWISGQAPDLPWQGMAKTRYRQKDIPCRIESIDDKTCRVSFESPQRAPTPGQSVVFYTGDICLGGGIIDRTGTQ